MTLDDRFGMSGRTALVTGATGGIGSAIVDALALAGARLLLAADDAAGLDAAAARIPDAQTYLCDLADPEARGGLIAHTLARLGRVDALICNAGVSGRPAAMGVLDRAEREHVFQVNLDHPLDLSVGLAPHMAAAGGGSIVLTSSIAGLRGNARLGAYGLTKAALLQLARNLAVEWGPAGVRTNAVAPGLIATGWAEAILSDPPAAERRMSLTPLRRIGQPREVADAVLFLAGPGSSFITGHCLVVDGGTLISDGN